MRRAARLYRRFVASRRGVAAIEFAAIMPVLAIILLAAFDAGRALAIYMKVRAATYALAAITNQYPTIAATDMTGITGATSTMLAPYSSTPAVVTISQITVSVAGVATVAWSYSLNGTARGKGSSITVPTKLAVANSYLILAEVSYTYTPMFGFFGSGGITLSDQLFVTPRSVTCIPYTPITGTLCL